MTVFVVSLMSGFKGDVTAVWHRNGKRSRLSQPKDK
jgi:hypothetical protein